jgi:hypothetical protein
MSSPTYRRENGPWIGTPERKRLSLSDIWDGRGKGRVEGERIAERAVFPDDKHTQHQEQGDHGMRGFDFDFDYDFLIFLMLAPVLLGYRGRTPNGSHL